MILMWASAIFGFSLEKNLITSALKMLGMRSPTQFMNFLLRDPVSALKKMGSLPPRYRKLLEKNIESGVKKHFKGGLKVQIDFKKLSEMVEKQPKLAETIRKWNDNNVEVKKNGAVDVNKDAIANVRTEETAKLESTIGEFVKMSSSWVTGGVITDKVGKNEVKADIYIHGKAYEFLLKISTWNRMVRAIGSYGTGAGSVLWDTELRYKKKAVANLRNSHRKGSK